jgi:hypothetical protein
VSALAAIGGGWAALFMVVAFFLGALIVWAVSS